MAEPRVTVDPDVVMVQVHDTTVAYVPCRRELLALHPDAGRLVAAVAAGDPAAVPPVDVAPLVDDLVEQGVLQWDDTTGRRD